MLYVVILKSGFKKVYLQSAYFVICKVLTKRKKGYNVTNSNICSLQDRDNAKDRGQFKKLD